LRRQTSTLKGLRAVIPVAFSLVVVAAAEAGAASWQDGGAGEGGGGFAECVQIALSVETSQELDFGAVTVGAPRPRSVTVTNTGSFGDLDVVVMPLGDPIVQGQLHVAPTMASIAVSASQEFVIEYDPIDEHNHLDRAVEFRVENPCARGGPRKAISPPINPPTIVRLRVRGSATPPLFGYAGVGDAGTRQEVEDAAIPINLGVIDYDEANWLTLDSEELLDDFALHGIRAAVFVEGFIFEVVEVPESKCDFLGFPFIVTLRSDWENRLSLFNDLHGEFLTPDSVAFFGINSEVNNGCVPLDDVATLARAALEYFPDIPMGMGYAATNVPGGPQAQEPPTHVPGEIDVVGFWAYGTFDPGDPQHPQNANTAFFDPADPENPETDYGYLLGLLEPEQRVLLVLDAHYQSSPGGAHTVLGWTQEDLGPVALNYEAFVDSRPEIVGLLGFIWPSFGSIVGTRDLPQSVREAHREVGCRVVPASGC